MHGANGHLGAPALVAAECLLRETEKHVRSNSTTELRKSNQGVSHLSKLADTRILVQVDLACDGGHADVKPETSIRLMYVLMRIDEYVNE